MLKDSAPFSSVVTFPVGFLKVPTDISLDSGFKEFFRYCESQDIPLIIVSRYAKEQSQSQSFVPVRLGLI